MRIELPFTYNWTGLVNRSCAFFRPTRDMQVIGEGSAAQELASDGTRQIVTRTYAVIAPGTPAQQSANAILNGIGALGVLKQLKQGMATLFWDSTQSGNVGSPRFWYKGVPIECRYVASGGAVAAGGAAVTLEVVTKTGGGV